ncbi:hypothetical protein [Sulfurovum sp.]|uniref:hypothetical protein n=1 Tax=Sulfurovum sp. TaxID=1969726 RepID=UPI00356A6196
MFDLIIKYGSMPSTWKGIIGIATAAGLVVSPELAAQIVALGIAVIGAINVVRNEKK